MSVVTRELRFSRTSPCPICGGHPDMPKGRGVRCWGFVSTDRVFVHCTRGERAGDISVSSSGTYPHRIRCRCADGCTCKEHRGRRAEGCWCAERCSCCACGTSHGSARCNPVVEQIPTAAEQTRNARAIWDAARPAAGTLAERYLRARGITIPVPASLRFAVLWHVPSRRELPAMVARVDNARGEFVAIHRTFIRSDGSGRVDKRMLGPTAGGAVRFGPPAHKIGLAEGIESALAVATAIPELSVWAALSAPGLRRIELPPMPLGAEIVILADNDPPGLDAAECAGRRLVGEGRRVRVAKPPREGLDFNDMLQDRGVG